MELSEKSSLRQRASKHSSALAMAQLSNCDGRSTVVCGMFGCIMWVRCCFTSLNKCGALVAHDSFLQDFPQPNRTVAVHLDLVVGERLATGDARIKDNLKPLVKGIHDVLLHQCDTVPLPPRTPESACMGWCSRISQSAVPSHAVRVENPPSPPPATFSRPGELSFHRNQRTADASAGTKMENSIRRSRETRAEL